MAAYSINQLNAIFKHIMMMNGAEITKELDALKAMSLTLKPLLHPVTNDIEGIENRVEDIIRIYVSFKLGQIDDDAMNSILEHKEYMMSLITANGAIGGYMLGYLNAEDQIIQDKSTMSIETVAIMHGNEKAAETEDTKETNVETSAKESLKDNTKKFLDIINNGVK